MTNEQLESGSKIHTFKIIEGCGVVFFTKPVHEPVQDNPGIWERIMRVFRAPKLPEQHTERYVAWRSSLNGNWYGDYLVLKEGDDASLTESVMVLESQAAATLQELKKKQT